MDLVAGVIAFFSLSLVWGALALLVLFGQQKNIPLLNGVSRNMALIVTIGGFILTGGLGAISGLSTGSVLADNQDAGDVTVVLSGGVVGTTTSLDYYHDTFGGNDDEVKFYVTDASVADGGYINVTATIERTSVKDATTIEVSCNAPDQEISGITADSLVEKTNGEVDLTIGGSGTHRNDNTVVKNVAYAEGDASETVVISFEQEETYQDAMSELDDQYVISCTANGVPFAITNIANS
jgi:hypothetical protein